MIQAGPTLPLLPTPEPDSSNHLDPVLFPQLLDAAEAGNLTAVDELAKLDEQNVDGNTALIFAVSSYTSQWIVPQPCLLQALTLIERTALAEQR